MSLSPVVIKAQICFVVPFTNFTSPPFWAMVCQMLQPHMSLGIVFSGHLLLTQSAEKEVLPNPLQICLFLASTLKIRY